MLCPKCGFYTEKEEAVCPECGTVLRDAELSASGGARAIRQGRRAREAVRQAGSRKAETPEREMAGRSARGAARRRAGHTATPVPTVAETREQAFYPETGSGEDEEPAPFDRGYRPVYTEEAAAARKYAPLQDAPPRPRGHRVDGVNWMKMGFILAVAVVVVLGSGWVFLTRTDAGQRMMARMGRDANSTALWAVGDEQMNEGNIDGAIASFEKAKKQDEAESIVDVDGLLLLGSAYEAAGRVEDAAALYEEIYTQTPSRPEAYASHIRILRASDREGDLARAGELMKIAYDKTGDYSFATQRSDLLPAPPEVDLTAGYYETKKYIAITSYEGFDVYYTFDDNAELPGDGILFTQRVFLDEGIHNLRAVAVNGELVSDELRGTYKIIMPSPMTPQSTLAPNTYKTRQRVRLKPGKDNINDADIVIYYTIDGSPPDADSPIFNGEAIILPTGWVTLQAVAVNRYGKLSNSLEVKYKIDVKPYPLSAWQSDETISGLILNQTGMVAFQEAFGEGSGYETLTLEGFESECRQYNYPWGYAIMNRTRAGWVLVELYLTDSSAFKLPRGTAIGDTESFVTGKFRDMGQVESASGNRGLYGTDDGTGKIWLQEDGTRIIRYQTASSDSRTQQLEYRVNRAGSVYAVDWKYIP